ncbi:hypothetical protein MNEG_13405, partial [Monoraphidium neglectum]
MLTQCKNTSSALALHYTQSSISPAASVGHVCRAPRPLAAQARLLPRPPDLADDDVIKSLVFSAGLQPVLVVAKLSSKARGSTGFGFSGG